MAEEFLLGEEVDSCLSQLQDYSSARAHSGRRGFWRLLSLHLLGLLDGGGGF